MNEIKVTYLRDIINNSTTTTIPITVHGKDFQATVGQMVYIDGGAGRGNGFGNGGGSRTGIGYSDGFGDGKGDGSDEEYIIG